MTEIAPFLETDRLILRHTETDDGIGPPEFHDKPHRSCENQIEVENHSGRMMSFSESPEDGENDE